MWKYIIRFILRNRWLNLVGIFLITVFFAWQASQVKMSYEMAQMLPETDSVYIEFQNFKKQFGKDGNVMLVGVKNDSLTQLKYFNLWYDLTYKLKDIKGVKGVLSLAKSFNLEKDDSLRRFVIAPIFKQKPKSQSELDSLLGKIKSNPFYQDILFNKEGATIIAITLDQDFIGSNSRFSLLEEIENEIQSFNKASGFEIHYSGLPYIRIVMSKIIKEELIMFSLLTLLIASVLLLAFFKSFKAVFFPMIIVSISVIVSLGMLVLFGYQITILTGILPPLITIIAVENNIFLLNKYYQEFKIHGNKVKALSRMIQTVGTPMLLTNLTTAVGFGAFIITQNHLLLQFGVITSLSIIMVFILSLILVPIFYSLLPEPKFRHLKYLDRKSLSFIIEFVKRISVSYRPLVYFLSGAAVIAGFWGMSMLHTSGNVVDDIPQGDKIYTDLQFFEKEFKGVLPFEIKIDTRKPQGVLKTSTLKRIEKLEKVLETYPEFSKTISIADLVKISKQAYFNGDPSKYSLPNSNERLFIMNYIPKEYSQGTSMLKSFVDSNLQVTRLSVQMKNIGSDEIDILVNKLRPQVDSIFGPKKYDVLLTGTSIVFLKGTSFLVNNLQLSLLLAILVIALMMMVLFKSIKIAAIALLPNLLPLLLTAALMGFFNINIKPSTVIIFSIALGISVDNTIHFLSRYRLSLKKTDWNIRESVMMALEETTQSMIYSSIILFLGFSVFMFSSFGGTQSLGKLISFTLIMAMLSNLVLLPTLLLTMEKRILKKQFKKNYLEIFDDDDDVDVDALKIQEK